MRALIRKIYRAIPFKSPLMHAIRAIGTPPRAIYQRLHFVGPFNVKNAEGKTLRLHHYGTYLENNIFWTGLYGNFEGKSLETWEKLCRRAKTIFDIGANTGVYALLAKLNRPDAKVFAFEPIPAVFRKLQANAAANGFDVVCDPRAVSDANGSAVIYLPENEHLYSVTVNKNLNRPEIPVQKLEVQTVRLTDFCREHAIEKVDLLKIDVETHEPEVLSGMQEILIRDRPDMIVEILLDDVGRKVESILEGLDYAYFHIDEKHGLVRQQNLRGHEQSYNYLICQPSTARALGLI
ncbi:MAG: FkbM family methyltransferase [Bacteroidia bacterium]|nr:FkbM family methyltransferase [Bacteroidia bacterium]